MPTADDKLDRLVNMVGDLRVAVTALAGDVKGGTVQVSAIQTLIGDIEARLRIVERHVAIQPDAATVDRRIGALEKYQWKQIGIAVGASAPVASALTLFLHH